MRTLWHPGSTPGCSTIPTIRWGQQYNYIGEMGVPASAGALPHEEKHYV